MFPVVGSMQQNVAVVFISSWYESKYIHMEINIWTRLGKTTSEYRYTWDEKYKKIRSMNGPPTESDLYN